MRVVVLDDVHRAYDGTEGVRRMRERVGVDVFTEPFGDPSALRGYDVLVANRERTRFTRELLHALPDARLLVQTGNHAHHIDFDAARACGIAVGKASGGHSIGAAELALALALAVMRRIPASDAAMRRGEWSTPSTPVLHGKVFGIVGLGRVGGHVARLAAAFGMRVVAWGPRLTAARAAEVGVDALAFDELLAVSDVVSIHAPLTPESTGLVDARALALMKPTAVLVNTARGAIVDERALVASLRAGRLAGAGLDVFATEPLPPGHPLAALPNVVLTPHLGWPTDLGYEQFARAACEVVLAYLAGRAFPTFP